MKYRAGFVGVIGQPNSGKSTLVNTLVGEKVSIVTSKPQTTRRRTVGIYTTPEYQLLFTDAPGIIGASAGLNKFLSDEAQDVVEQSDVLMAVLNLDEKREDKIDQTIQMVAASGKPWIAVITKTDLSFVHRISILREKLKTYNVPVLQVSAQNDAQECREKLFPVLKELLPESPGPLYDSELYSLMNMREIASEVIREKCFEHLHQEIPFGLAVRLLRFIEDEGPVVKIYAEILVAKDNHRGIVVGRGGEMLGRIGTKVRKELEPMLKRQVYLDLHVATKKNWMRDAMIMKELGYVLPQNA